jgi:hypothetical protein
MPAADIQRVDFGRLDAESDPNLLNYFLVTGTVRGIVSGAKLVIGRKGSGKTALFTHLAANLETRVIELDLLDYVFELHRGFTEVGLPAERATRRRGSSSSTPPSSGSCEPRCRVTLGGAVTMPFAISDSARMATVCEA